MRMKESHATPTASRKATTVLVAYILPLLWYVVPTNAFPASASRRFYPDSNISGRSRFEQYREDWRLSARTPGPEKSTRSYKALSSHRFRQIGGNSSQF